jgi:hypothetical protein
MGPDLCFSDQFLAKCAGNRPNQSSKRANRREKWRFCRGAAARKSGKTGPGAVFGAVFAAFRCEIGRKTRFRAYSGLKMAPFGRKLAENGPKTGELG